MTEHIFTAQTAGERLDKATTQHTPLSRAHAQALIQAGLVTVNGGRAKAAHRLKVGDVVRVVLPVRETALVPQPIPLAVVYEDARLAVIDKPAGMTVHPGARDEAGTLVHALLARYPEIAQMPVVPKRAGIVHRLDRGTSGLIVVARDDAARRQLGAQFAARTVTKAYVALLEKAPPQAVGTVNAPLAPDPHHPRRRRVYAGGEPALTEYRVVARYGDGSALVRLALHTGRTHQIRAHMAHMGCVLAGDVLYGARAAGMPRHFLHAEALAFDHPDSGQRLAFTSPLPPELETWLARLPQIKG